MYYIIHPLWLISPTVRGVFFLKGLKMEDLTGKKFGRLTVIKKVENSKDNHIVYLCLCECGNFQNVYATHLKNGKRKECKKCVFTKSNKKHGLKGTKAYSVWCSIKNRCYYKKNINYKDYGGRGIIVCGEWLNPVNFCNWFNERYQEGLTIDRIDVNGNYEPNNCRLITNKEQQNNKRNNVRIEYNGEIKTASELAEIVGISSSAMCQRIKRHGNDERIFNKQWTGKHKNQYTK